MSDLTPRQQEVATLLAEGLTPAQAGERLGLTEATVRQHRYDIYKLLGIKRAGGTPLIQLTLYAIAHGWVHIEVIEDD